MLYLLPLLLNYHHYYVSEAMPEFFGFAIEGGAAADHGPELPSELAAQVAECPPASQEVLAFGCGEARGEILAGGRVAVFEIAFDLLLQRLDHARDSDQHRNPFPAEGRHNFGWVKRVFEDNGRAQQRRKKNSQELSEHVAQRKQVQEANRMHEH